jgi:hypothetical protein
LPRVLIAEKFLFVKRSFWAYCVEKLRHAKIVSETWNAVPTIGKLANVISCMAFWRDIILLIWPFRAIKRVLLLAAVSRIAAILPNDLTPTNMNRPERPFADCLNAATQLSHCGHSCIAQRFGGSNVGQRTKRYFAAEAPMASLSI